MKTLRELEKNTWAAYARVNGYSDARTFFHERPDCMSWARPRALRELLGHGKPVIGIPEWLYRKKNPDERMGLVAFDRSCYTYRAARITPDGKLADTVYLFYAYDVVKETEKAIQVVLYDLWHPRKQEFLPAGEQPVWLPKSVLIEVDEPPATSVEEAVACLD